MSSRLPFQLEATARGTRARAGRLHTPHGEVLTPRFMPVGTQGAVRGQTVDTLRASGARILLANTYHLMQRPGLGVFRRFGGIHRFIGWDGPVLTDSGGYQIFSLPGQRVITEEGARFRPERLSRIAGADAPSQPGPELLLTPESSIEAQLAINSDVMMALDVCVPGMTARAGAIEAMDRTHRWAERSLRARGSAPNALFGIVQGASFEDLRRASAAALTSLPFDGFAIGGLAVGESKREREDLTELVAGLLPADRPRYLMGVGTPIDLLEAVHRGVDLFDCIIPTAWAQRGAAFTRAGRVDLRRTTYRLSDAPLDPECPCPVCARHSRGYLHHLVKAREVLAWQLLGTHNLHFYSGLMAELRQALVEDRFEGLYLELRGRIAGGDEKHPAVRGKSRTVRPVLQNH
ncbi:MAG: tRNA guanosine(34) transglycosylase Tgt [Bdellovibrionales bacterium]|nr:tRNA guanosine(34) transglycosylase Tgt [Bdellovibrionales bacterium]